MWTIINIIKDAKINKKPLHVCYVDVKKAYDSVEHWGINKILTAYGFDKEFVKLIGDTDNKYQFITLYGLTDVVIVIRRVR